MMECIIHTHVDLDGKEVAKSTNKHMLDGNLSERQLNRKFILFPFLPLASL
jgi:hypothetical protein